MKLFTGGKSMLVILLSFVVLIGYAGTCSKKSSSDSSAGSSAPAAAQGPAWGVPALLETDNTGAVNGTYLAMNASGNAIALWEQSNGTTYHLYANSYIAGSGWSSGTLVETEAAFDVFDIRLAMNSSNKAIAVWRQFDGTTRNIWANVAVTGTIWGTAQLIETDNTGDTYNPQVAINNSGDAVAIWIQNDGVTDNICANFYISGTGWGVAGIIEANPGTAGSPQIVLDNAGNAIAVWTQNDGIWFSIYSNRYISGTGWAGSVTLEGAGGDAYAPHISVDGAGNAMAVWAQAPSPSIYANRYVSGTGWAGAEEIEPGTVGASVPQVSMYGIGNAIVVWNQVTIQYGCIAFGNTYISGTGWAGAEIICSGTEVTTEPRIAINASGDAFAIWYQFDLVRTSIYANRYVAGTGWGTSTAIESRGENAGSHKIGIDNSGRAIAIWVQSDGTADSLWYNRFE